MIKLCSWDIPSSLESNRQSSLTDEIVSCLARSRASLISVWQQLFSLISSWILGLAFRKLSQAPSRSINRQSTEKELCTRSAGTQPQALSVSGSKLASIHDLRRLGDCPRDSSLLLFNFYSSGMVNGYGYAFLKCEKVHDLSWFTIAPCLIV